MYFSKNKRLVCTILVLCIIFSFCFVTSSIAVSEFPANLCNLTSEGFSKYITFFINSHKAFIKDSIVNSKLDKFEINEVTFDINTGIVKFGFSAHYTDKVLRIPYKISFTGVVLAELEVSNDYSIFGVRLIKLESLKIPKCPSAISKVIKDYLNSRISHVFFWQNEQAPTGYIPFNINNFNNIIQGILRKEVTLMPIAKKLPGGTLTVIFDSIICDGYDFNTGKAKINANISLNVQLFSGKSASYEKFCYVEIGADFFTDATDSLWISLTQNTLAIKDCPEGINREINKSLDKMLIEQFGTYKLMKLGSGIDLDSSKDTKSNSSLSNTSTESSADITPVSKQDSLTRQGIQAPEYWEKNSLNCPNDPVVVKGMDIPSLEGIDPRELVAFKYDNGWQQIPMQVDEMAMVSLAKVYNANEKVVILFELFGRKDVSILTYTDPNTFTGGDPDKTLDSDDEIAFMSKDAGGTPAHFFEPKGVIPGTGSCVKISNPINEKAKGYVYLFKQDGTLQQSAGKQYVKYDFKLLSGDYKTTYKTTEGPNKENSWVTTPYYSQHFSDRWIEDELHIFKGNSTGVNILDRHKELFKPGTSTRTEDTFSKGADSGFPAEGCFIVNKSGPVRAVRSYLGANSGFLTQREHIFYEDREDINTYLRVHPISGVMDFYDYSPAAAGMTYSNNLNKSGVLIDGLPDSLVTGPIQWELVNGIQGSLVMFHKADCNIPGFSNTSYYLDNNNPKDRVDMQFTGDPYAYGSSGIWVNNSIPNTDPSSGNAYNMTLKRYIYFESPEFSTIEAEKFSEQLNNPLITTIYPLNN